MGFRFRKSRKIGRGTRVTVTDKGVGASLGGRWARVSANSQGRVSRSVSLPGTGLSYGNSSSRVGRATSKRSRSRGWLGTLGMALAMILLGAAVTIGMLIAFTDFSPLS